MKVPTLESVFLNRSPLPEVREFNRVLVLGGGRTGRELSRRLTKEGFEVLLIGDTDEVGLAPGPTLCASSALGELQGFVGAFDVTLGSGPEHSIERVGIVVAAASSELFPNYQPYGVCRSQRVMSLSDLERMVQAEKFPVTARGKWFHAAFLCGLHGDTDPAMFARVFDAVERLRTLCDLQAYVFTRNVKVAAPGLERAYRRVRDAGVLFFKFDGPGPVFEDVPDGPTMVFTDPIAGIELELVPDLLVVDEDLRPPSSLAPVLNAIPSSAATAPFLQPESTRFCGVRTAKAGILALGAARGDFSHDNLIEDVEAAVAAIKAAAVEEARNGLPGAPVIDPGKCTICLTCVRLCPHGAISFRKRAEADPASCVRCGICAAECPMNAITLAPPTGEIEVRTRIEKGLAETDRTQRVMAFLCSKSAAQAMKGTAPTIRDAVVPIVVPCAGTVDPGHILAAFQHGADAVIIAGCHIGNCASIYGNILAGERVHRTRLLLEEAGIDPHRLIFTALASNTPDDFAQAVLSLTRSLETQRM